MQVGLLAATLMLGHAAARRGWGWIGEAGIALLLGLAVGLAVVAVKDTYSTYAQAIGFRKKTGPTCQTGA